MAPNANNTGTGTLRKTPYLGTTCDATVRVSINTVQTVGSAVLHSAGALNISAFYSSWPLGAFRTCFYNHAHRTRLEKLLYIELPDPDGGFTSETAGRRFRK